MFELVVKDFKIEIRNMLKDLEEKIRMIKHGKVSVDKQNYKIKQSKNSRAKKHLK